MFVDRLIQRDKPDSLTYGTILQVDPRNKRAKIRGRNSLELWATFAPADFPDLAAGQTVAVGIAAAGAFVIRLLTSTLPAESTLLEL